MFYLVGGFGWIVMEYHTNTFNIDTTDDRTAMLYLILKYGTVGALITVMIHNIRSMGKRMFWTMIQPRRQWEQWKMFGRHIKDKIAGRSSDDGMRKSMTRVTYGLAMLYIGLAIHIFADAIIGWAIHCIGLLLLMLYGMFSSGGGGGGRKSDPPMGGDSDQRITPEVRYGT